MTAANENSFSESPLGPKASGVPKAADSSTAIQAGPPAPGGETSIPLPPIAAPAQEAITPEELAGEIRRLDWCLGLVLLVLAFLLASFAIRNTDFFLHLAQGRLYAHGEFNFGADQFTYTTANTYWVNHSWLFDLILYGIAAVSGGPDSPVAGAVLVIIKGLLVMLLAWLMFKTSRPGLSKWAPAMCTGLALIAMSPRLLYQPTLISLLFLALTLYILQQPRHVPAASGRTGGNGRSPLAVYWWLPALFALWVNLDAWWILGPFTVALFLIGQTLQQILTPVRTGEDAPELGQLSRLALVLVVGVAAGLLNPHHYHAFALPALISPASATDVYVRDDIFKILFQTPLSEDYFLPGLGMNAAGLAYFPLVAVGLLSFVLSFFSEWRWWRILVWLAFAALSAYRVRCVPFFAVVAGPITALNFQDFAAYQFGTMPRVERGWRAWSLGGRVLSLLVGLVVLLAAWPGWLHVRGTSDASQNHRVSWQMRIDPSLRKAAEQIGAWRDQGLLKPEENGFNFSPDIANYCAWYCADEKTGLPKEKCFLDYRIELFPRDVAKRYIDIRQDIRSADESRSFLVPDIFRKQMITHVIVNRNDPEFPLAWGEFLRDWPQWSLLGIVEGRTVIFRWNDPLKRRQPPSGLQRLDVNALAFGPGAMRAPGTAPAQGAQQQDLLARFWYGPPAQPVAEEEARRYLEYFNLVNQLWPRPYLAGSNVGMLSATAAAMGTSPAVGTVAGPGALSLSCIPVYSALTGNPHALQFCLQGKDYGPPGAPVLAVRASRKAVSESPNHAGGYFSLATAYMYLWRSQEEQWVGQTQFNAISAQRQQLRQIQVATALEQGLKIRPNESSAHQTLADLYLQMNYYDLALEHFQQVVKLTSQQSTLETKEGFKQRQEEQEKALKSVEDEVRRQRNEFELAATNKPVLEKAHIAITRKLGKRALDVLLQADPSQMSVPELDLLLGLLLTTGAGSLEKGLDDVREYVLSKVSTGLGRNYERYAFLLEAAAGNYREADNFIAEAIRKLEQDNTAGVLGILQMQTFGGKLAGILQPTNNILQNVRAVAEYKVLRAMVALEAGDVAAAARHCQEALDMNNGQPFMFESRMIAVHYLDLIKKAGGAK